MDKVEEVDDQVDIFNNQFLAVVFNLLDKSSSKVVQSGAIACLTKVLINCPDEVLFSQLDDITDHMAQVLKMKLFQAHQQMLECIISLVFHVQEEFRPYYHKFLGIFMD